MCINIKCLYRYTVCANNSPKHNRRYLIFSCGLIPPPKHKHTNTLSLSLPPPPTPHSLYLQQQAYSNAKNSSNDVPFLDKNKKKESKRSLLRSDSIKSKVYECVCVCICACACAGGGKRESTVIERESVCVCMCVRARARYPIVFVTFV